VAALATIEEALAQILARVRPLDHERVPLAEAAGRVLAEPATAVVDLPPFASSAMDGFAIRAADAPGTLSVVARIAAGRPADRSLAAGEAMGIATGGAVPAGADCIVPIERVVAHDNNVVVPPGVAVGDNIRSRGSDTSAGAEIVGAGTRLSVAQLGGLAAGGVARVVCGRRPHVAIVTTGTELRQPGEHLAPGEIYESNGLMLEALCHAAGAVAERPPPVEDDAEAHRVALERGLSADVLITSGGVSVGPHDLVRRIERELGVEEVFWGVAMRPGKPVSFATRGDVLVFGLPGNPVSSLVGAELFVRPALLALQGASAPGPGFDVGVLSTSVRRSAARDDLLRAHSEATSNGVVLTPLPGQESHMIVRAAAANALVHVPRGSGELAAGSRVRYLRLE
jgi:molybdopterin molybdotransferase